MRFVQELSKHRLSKAISRSFTRTPRRRHAPNCGHVSRLAALASRRKSPPWSAIWRLTKRASSPARSLRSTADGPPLESVDLPPIIQTQNGVPMKLVSLSLADGKTRPGALLEDTDLVVD